MKRKLAFFTLAALSIVPLRAEVGQNMPNLKQLNEMSARFVKTPLKVDISRLSGADKKALVKLIEAARIYNDIYMKQLWAENQSCYERSKNDKSALGKARQHYYWLNKGPWSNLDGFKAFIPNVPDRKPLGANFYPENMREADFENWLKTVSAAEQEDAKGFFTVIRWQDEQKKTLKAVPYSKFYQPELSKAAKLLHEAAELTDNPSLKKFLHSRADAFISNNYYESDKDWMDLDAPLDITIGPYETYNDELFGYKAAFEAFVNLRDDKETAKLALFSSHLQAIENNLPLDPQYRNPKLGAGAAIRVVDQIYNSGDAAHGVQTAAYNLPNDDKVVQEKGSKRVMLKNVQEAKFEQVLLPIAKRTLPAASLKDISFEPFFSHILAHELMHGLGPHQIKKDGKETNPRIEIKELYSAIEEAKADVTGLFALQFMADHIKELGLQDVLEPGADAERQLYTTYLASAFRTLRFGLSEAHGKGMAIQFNYLMDHGAFKQNADGTYSVEMTKIKKAIEDLDRLLLTIEAQGDYAAAKKLITEMAVVRPELQKTLDKLKDIPNDIEPVFVTADELAPPGR
jgi:hypothetical protein